VAILKAACWKRWF